MTEKKCPFCAETIKVEAVLCRFCDRDLPVEQPEHLEETVVLPPFELKPIHISLAVIAVVVAIVVIAFFVEDARERERAFVAARARARAAIRETGLSFDNPIIPPGTCRWRTGGNYRPLDSGIDIVQVAVSSSALDELFEYIVAKDTAGIKRLYLSGQVFAVPQNTCARILDYGFLESEIRIVEGKHSGRRGFVVSDWLKR